MCVRVHVWWSKIVCYHAEMCEQILTRCKGNENFFSRVFYCPIFRLNVFILGNIYLGLGYIYVCSNWNLVRKNKPCAKLLCLGTKNAQNRNWIETKEYIGNACDCRLARKKKKKSTKLTSWKQRHTYWEETKWSKSFVDLKNKNTN